jgi:undecaprenyl diphosphate synthase
MQLPRHIAIVMDGNGRWAKKRGYPRFFGHVRGCHRVREIVNKCSELNIPALTLYAFSTENWNRPKEEVEGLWKLLKKFLVRDADALAEKNIRLCVIGDIQKLSEEVQSILNPLIERLKFNTGLRLTFALSYGAKDELMHAAKNFALDCLAGMRSPYEMEESVFSSYLSQTEEPREVDLFIRTSGEKRLSNFLLWQSAYAELIFDETYWPDFCEKNLLLALREYEKRERRFGKIPSLQQIS